MKKHGVTFPIRKAWLFFIIIIMATSACGPKPPDDLQDMVVVKSTKVIFQFNRPIMVGFLDEGARVRARPTSEAGWYEVWWRPRNRWKYGYVETDCLRTR